MYELTTSDELNPLASFSTSNDNFKVSPIDTWYGCKVVVSVEVKPYNILDELIEVVSVAITVLFWYNFKLAVCQVNTSSPLPVPPYSNSSSP